MVRGKTSTVVSRERLFDLEKRLLESLEPLSPERERLSVLSKRLSLQAKLLSFHKERFFVLRQRLLFFSKHHSSLMEPLSLHMERLSSNSEPLSLHMERLSSNSEPLSFDMERLSSNSEPLLVEPQPLSPGKATLSRMQRPYTGISGDGSISSDFGVEHPERGHFGKLGLPSPSRCPRSPAAVDLSPNGGVRVFPFEGRSERVAWCRRSPTSSRSPPSSCSTSSTQASS